MAVTLEPVAFVVRAGPDHHKHGDPYTHSGTMLLAGDAAHFAGVTADAFWRYRKQFIEHLKAMGIRTLTWQRIKDGKVRKVELKIPKDD